MRFVLVFLVLFLAVGANLPENMIAQLGLDPTYLTAALAAWLITALVVERHILLIVLVTLLVVGANLPADMAAGIGIDRQVLIATLVAVVLAPKVRQAFE